MDLLWVEDAPVEINEDIDNFDLVPEFDLVNTSHQKYAILTY